MTTTTSGNRRESFGLADSKTAILPGFDSQQPACPQSSVKTVTIGNATLYRANCFDVLPRLHDIDAAVTDRPLASATSTAATTTHPTITTP